MPTTISQSKTTSIGGTSFTQKISAEGNNLEETSPTIPAAKVGALSTRTSDTQGVLTMNAGHGFTNHAPLDLFWSGGSCRIPNPTVSSNTVTFTGAVGDALPDAAAAITAMHPVSAPIDFDADELVGFAVKCAKMGYVSFRNDGVEILAVRLIGDTLSYSWIDDGNSDNPLNTGATADRLIDELRFSHCDGVNSRVMEAAFVLFPV